MLPSGIQSASSQAQYLLAGSDGTTWQDIDAATLALNIPSGPAPATVVLSGNADLWTERPGVNQDIGIFLSAAGGGDQLVGWKESGGNAGTFSPNAAFVQAVVPLAAGTSYIAKLKWKTNVSTPGTIRAGAGLGPEYSPTTLTAQVVASGTSTASSSSQYMLSRSDGTTWQDIDQTAALTVAIPALPADQTILISANADLWTQNPGINQDLGIFVNDQLVAWKESGGFAGTFSPNAAFVQIAFRAVADQPYVVRLEWKSNIPTAGTIRAGAGLGPQYSPTSLTVEIPPAG
ncbi:MAG: hypothetical protein E6I74_14255 [Chloroflexi bacterium]|nr:MAG: hypothetical protein E6I74_14255 [Chloroflexota bacterium]